MTEISAETREQIRLALEGDSNDAEHEALAAVAGELGIDWIAEGETPDSDWSDQKLARRLRELYIAEDEGRTPLDLPETENEVLTRLNLPPDETEQGLTREAQAEIDNYIREYAGTMYEATFRPQAWQNDIAIPVDPQGPVSWDATEFVEQFLRDGNGTYSARRARTWLIGTLEHGDHDDILWQDPKAPAWIQNWGGPFDTYLKEVR